MTKFMPPSHPTSILRKWAIDLLFKNNRISKHVINFKTFLQTSFRVDVSDVCSLSKFYFPIKIQEKLTAWKETPQNN